MGDTELALRFAVALGLGILLGLERERTKGDEGGAGVRTFALISLAGALAGYLSDRPGLEWLAAAMFAATGLLVIAMYVVTALRGEIGITTEISALLAFLLGLLCAHGLLQMAGSVAVAMALLLALKDWLHRVAGRINATDIHATLKFGIVTLIILPLVPDVNYGPEPLNVINPYQIWLMVVLISALNFISYLLIKVVGPEHGVGLAGLLGGLVSSTAVTLAFAQRSRRAGEDADALAFGIVLAWTVMFLRVAVMSFLISVELGRALAPGIGLLAFAGIACSAWLWRRRMKTRNGERGSVPPGSNPFELNEAIKFGLLFGVVIIAAKAAQAYFGDAGLYIAAAVAGLTDVDAITLAMAHLVRSEPASLSVATRAVIIAVIANTLTKNFMATGFGSAELRRTTLPVALLLIAAGGLAVFLS